MRHRYVLAAGALALAVGLAAPAAADPPLRPFAAPGWSHAVGHHPIGWRHGHDTHRFGHRHGRHHPRAAYRCAPCRRGYTDYGAFRRHLHARHHVPFWRIPHVIVRAVFGWIFYG